MVSYQDKRVRYRFNTVVYQHESESPESSPDPIQIYQIRISGNKGSLESILATSSSRDSLCSQLNTDLWIAYQQT